MRPFKLPIKKKLKQKIIDSFLSRIKKNTNNKGCWHLVSHDGNRYIDKIYYWDKENKRSVGIRLCF